MRVPAVCRSLVAASPVRADQQGGQAGARARALTAPGLLRCLLGLHVTGEEIPDPVFELGRKSFQSVDVENCAVVMCARQVQSVKQAGRQTGVCRDGGHLTDVVLSDNATLSTFGLGPESDAANFALRAAGVAWKNKGKE